MDDSYDSERSCDSEYEEDDEVVPVGIEKRRVKKVQ